jgi:hypothetical protein
MRPIASGVVIAAAVVVADLFLYQTFVVPRLPDWRTVPMHWWGVVGTPIIVAVVVVGFRSATFKQLLVSSLVAAILSAVYLAWAGQTGQPGHLKSLAYEAAGQFWLWTPIALIGAFGLLMGLVRSVSIVIRHNRAG